MARLCDRRMGNFRGGYLAHWFGIPNRVECFPISFANNTPAIFDGNTAAIRDHVHVEGGQVQLFANRGAAVGAFSGPWGLQAGSRNNLRGPHFSEVSMGLSKTFPVTEQV